MPRAIRLEETRPSGNERARGLVSSRVSGRRVRAVSYLPSEDMRALVRQYWIGQWDLRGQAPHVTEMLGDPCVNIVFERGPSGTSGRVVGVWTRLWRRKLENTGSVRGVKLRAGTVRAVFGEPAVDFANRMVPLRQLFDEAAELERAVLEPEDDGEAFGALEAWLRARAQRAELDENAADLVDRIAADPELTTAQQLADASGLSLRALQRLFRDHVGAPPKWVIRRNRLQEVATRIEKGEATNLAALAAELGYADQAHLARDFKGVVGRSPSEFAAQARESL